MKYSLRFPGQAILKAIWRNIHIFDAIVVRGLFFGQKKDRQLFAKIVGKKNNSFFRPRTDDRGTKHCAAIYLLQRVPFSDFVADGTKAKKRPKYVLTQNKRTTEYKSRTSCFSTFKVSLNKKNTPLQLKKRSYCPFSVFCFESSITKSVWGKM